MDPRNRVKLGLLGLFLAGNAVPAKLREWPTSNIKPGKLGENPWAGALAQYFDPSHTVGLVTYLANSACVSHHGIYSALGGRIGRAFLGITEGFISDELIDAEAVAAQWSVIQDDRLGYSIPIGNNWRIVAERRGVRLPVR